MAGALTITPPMIVPLWNIENEQGKTSDDFLSSAQDGREAGFEQKVAKIVPYGPPIVQIHSRISGLGLPSQSEGHFPRGRPRGRLSAWENPEAWRSALSTIGLRQAACGKAAGTGDRYMLDVAQYFRLTGFGADKMMQRQREPSVHFHLVARRGSPAPPWHHRCGDRSTLGAWGASLWV